MYVCGGESPVEKEADPPGHIGLEALAEDEDIVPLMSQVSFARGGYKLKPMMKRSTTF